MLKRGIEMSLLRGTLTYGGVVYPCSHSPISTEQILSDGGFTPQTIVLVIVDADDAPSGGFTLKSPATLTAQDGRDYPIKLISNEADGSGYFVQLVCHHVHQGA